MNNKIGVMINYDYGVDLYEKFKKKLSQQIEAITKKYPTVKLI